MKLSASGLKLWHAALVGFATGALAYLSGLVTGTSVPGVKAFVLGLLIAGISRGAGYVLAATNAEPSQ